MITLVLIFVALIIGVVIAGIVVHVTESDYIKPPKKKTRMIPSVEIRLAISAKKDRSDKPSGNRSSQE